jgi:hypothetical protein
MWHKCNVQWLIFRFIRIACSQCWQLNSSVTHSLFSDVDVDAVNVGAIVAGQGHCDALRDAGFVK